MVEMIKVAEIHFASAGSSQTKLSEAVKHVRELVKEKFIVYKPKDEYHWDILIGGVEG